MLGYRPVTAASFDFSAAPIYRKTASLLKSRIEIATESREVVTRLNGREETRNLARPGDFIITGGAGERYVVSAQKFPRLYEDDPAHADRYRSRNLVRAIRLDEPVEILAPWGELQRTEAGGRICQAVADAADVYLIEREAFERTYALDAELGSAGGRSALG